MKKTETWTVSLYRRWENGTAIIRKPGRTSPVYEATRPTTERALLAALNGAGLDWVPGTSTATYRPRNGGASRRVNLNFVVEV